MMEKIARELEANPLWSQLTAVREGRVHIMEKRLYNLKPNHLWGDTAARMIFAPYEVPVGIVLSVIGGPVFLVLLLKRRGGHSHA